MGFKDWCTPPDFFKALDKQFHFTLDVAASHYNHLLPAYCTKDGLFYQFGSILEVDGLAYPWGNERVFCNPPYDHNLSKWVAKALKREAEVAVLLLPPSVDAEWFHKALAPGDKIDGSTLFAGGTIWNGWTGPDLGVYFMRGRLHFWRDGKPSKAPRAGNMLVIVYG